MITKLRASNISIETPVEGSETWVHVTVQQVFKDDDGKILNLIPRYDHISVPIKNIGMTFYEGFEPLIQEPLNVSGYGIGTLISSLIIKVMADKYGGEVTSEGDLVI